MNKILVCCLGGTIGSKVNDDGVIKLSATLDKTFFDKMRVKAEYKIVTPIIYSSENADIKYYKDALNGIVKAAQDIMPDAVLVLHGTDSMAYFTHLAHRVLSYMNLPLIVTGAKYPPDDPHSDAVRNVKFALDLLSAAIDSRSGSLTFGLVYSDAFMGQATFVQAAKVLDADFAGEYKKFAGMPQIEPLDREESEAFLASTKEPRILTIPDVPGYPFESIDVTKYDAILVEAYHSGTQNSKTLPTLVHRASSKGIKCYLAPVHSTHIKKEGADKSKEAPYDSEVVLKDAGIIPLADVPFESAWAQVVIEATK